MKRRKSFREILAANAGPIVRPAAHDALSARLIEMMGFQAMAISGSAMVASRYGLPDLGIAAREEMVAGMRDILSVTTIPAIGDGDDGYGDERSVRRTVAMYEAIGLAAISLEDQARLQKQPGQSASLSVISETAMRGKLAAALDARSDRDFLIIARTDAYGLLGIEEALKRGHAYLDAGADGLFVAGMKKPEDIERVGREFNGVSLSMVMYGGADYPWLSPWQVFEWGYRFVSYPQTLVLNATHAMTAALSGLAQGRATHDGDMIGLLDKVTGFQA